MISLVGGEWKQSCTLWSCEWGRSGDGWESYPEAESIDWFIEGQAFLIWLHAPTPFPSSPVGKLHLFLMFSCVLPVELTDRRGGGPRGWAWSRIIRPQESLALYKWFNSLWPQVSMQFPLSAHHSHILYSNGGELFPVVLLFLFQSDHTFKGRHSKLGI